MKTTVANALELISSAVQMDPEQDREMLLDTLNEIRSWIYLVYHRKNLAISYCECVVLEEYCQFCDTCNPTYIGFTLSPHIESLEGIRFNEHPVNLHSRWRAWSEGVNDCPRSVTAFSLINGVPVEREPLNCCASQYKFLADCRSDFGKSVRIVYNDDKDVRHTEELVLQEDYVATTHGVKTVFEITLPIHDGPITVADTQNRILSRYARGVLTPEYTRVRVEGLCVGQQLKVIGPRRFVPLYDDLEVVEVGDPSVLRELARFVNLNSREANTSVARQEATIHRQQAEDLITGLIERERGTKAHTRIKLPSTLGKSTTLYSAQRRRGCPPFARWAHRR